MENLLENLGRGEEKSGFAHARKMPAKAPVALVILFLLLGGFGAAADAQPKAGEPSGSEARLFYQKGLYDKALIAARNALAMAEKTVGPDDPGLAASLNNLALLYDVLGQYGQAEPLYRRR